MASGTLQDRLRTIIAQVEHLDPIRRLGKVVDCVGLVIESAGPETSIGDLCEIDSVDGGSRLAQVIGFRDGRVLLMPLEEPQGLRPGATVRTKSSGALAPVGPELLGRVIDGFSRPLDDLGPLHCSERRPLFTDAPGPMEREPITERLVTGVRVVDAMLPCGKGQRVGLFGGSGVGKSTLLAAIARTSKADVNVIAMIGERNREVREFIENNLGVEGMKRSVVIAATSDLPAPARVRAAFLAATVAEWFRDQGQDVMLIMDSVTRLAMAQREIGLAAGEPPSQKGYTPSVFQLMPRLFERAGNFGSGSITGIYTVLVEGDDLSEPIADAARSLLDGHIVLSRQLAAANHYPAIDVLESVSRLTNAVATQEQCDWMAKLRDAMASYRRSEDLINLGAYTAGSNGKLDAAVREHDKIQTFLRQSLRNAAPLDDTLTQLESLAEMV
jgi:flagellum-specific ATP synthase